MVMRRVKTNQNYKKRANKYKNAVLLIAFSIFAGFATNSATAQTNEQSSQAQEHPPQNETLSQTDQNEGRFQFETTQNGYIKFDRKTGQTSLCSQEGDNIVCNLVADEATALNEEIARLTQENEELRAQLAGAGDTVEDSSILPTNEEIDQMLDVFNHTMQRLRDMITQEGQETPQSSPEL